uniref:Putative ovule protein n=1 Tax=Solanum chacoense TaxID=4108 RepID=A0A0V0H1D8_SOLCH
MKPTRKCKTRLKNPSCSLISILRCNHKNGKESRLRNPTILPYNIQIAVPAQKWQRNRLHKNGHWASTFEIFQI